jgi:Trk K+ transport system NAD-binding subunit
MIAGKRFVIWGLSRLTTRVARRLAERQAEVIVVHVGEGDELAPLLGESVRLHHVRGNPEEALRAAGATEAACLLALADDDLANLQAAVLARRIAPEVPVVLRCFDPTLADQLEQGLNVRRAYSVSALSAPAFVAAALAEEVIETMYLGGEELPLCRLTVRPGSPLAGRSAGELKQQFHCAVIAHAGPDGVWRQAGGDTERIEAGEQTLIGGRLRDVLDLARQNSGRLDGPRPRRAKRAGWRAKKSFSSNTLLPWVGAGLTLLLVASMVLFSAALDLRPIDAFYFVITTATTTGYGDFSLRDAPAPVKLLGCVVMLSGGALLAVLFTHLAAVVTSERLEQQMGRRARRLSGHVIVAGLGNVGYRVSRLLCDLGIPSAVIEMAPDARFVEAVRERAAVLSGDARLPENLQRASIEEAVAFLACTNDDLANIQACLHARRLNPSIRTVARIFDDQLAEHLTEAFQIDAAISSGKLAAGAFVGAATEERALRPFRMGDLDYLAFRFEVTTPVSLAQIEAWRAQGVRLLGFRRQGGPVQPPSQLAAPFEPGDAAILAGPEPVIRALLPPEPPPSDSSLAGDGAVMPNDRLLDRVGVKDGHGRSD